MLLYVSRWRDQPRRGPSPGQAQAGRCAGRVRCCAGRVQTRFARQPLPDRCRSAHAGRGESGSAGSAHGKLELKRLRSYAIREWKWGVGHRAAGHGVFWTSGLTAVSREHYRQMRHGGFTTVCEGHRKVDSSWQAPVGGIDWGARRQSEVVPAGNWKYSALRPGYGRCWEIRRIGLKYSAPGARASF